MYIVLLCTLKRKNPHSNKDDCIISSTADSVRDAQSDKMTLLVQRVVALLLVCYVPLLIWRQYYYAVIIDGNHPDSLNIWEGIIEATVRVLLAINSSINPFIYAQTIPAFRDVVRGYIRRSA